MPRLPRPLKNGTHQMNHAQGWLIDLLGWLLTYFYLLVCWLGYICNQNIQPVFGCEVA